MKFLDLMRKLGVFRSGTKKATYTNAVDRPTEFMMDGVFDANKDLVHQSHTKK